MHLRDMQDRLPWGSLGTEAEAAKFPHTDMQHALLHVVKAIGKLAERIEDADHGRGNFQAVDVKRLLADIVICALRMADVNPDDAIDLERAVIDRVQEKNGADSFPEFGDGSEIWAMIEAAPEHHRASARTLVAMFHEHAGADATIALHLEKVDDKRVRAIVELVVDADRIKAELAKGLEA